LVPQRIPHGRNWHDIDIIVVAIDGQGIPLVHNLPTTPTQTRTQRCDAPDLAGGRISQEGGSSFTQNHDQDPPPPFSRATMIDGQLASPNVIARGRCHPHHLGPLPRFPMPVAHTTASIQGHHPPKGVLTCNVFYSSPNVIFVDDYGSYCLDLVLIFLGVQALYICAYIYAIQGCPFVWCYPKTYLFTWYQIAILPS
jgi:hypothetical protein